MAVSVKVGCVWKPGPICECKNLAYDALRACLQPAHVVQEATQATEASKPNPSDPVDPQSLDLLLACLRRTILLNVALT